MKKDKLFFSKETGDETCYTKAYITDEMKDHGLTETIVSEAKRDLGSDHFFCKAFEEVGVRGNDYEACGKNCEGYEPRNGKSGCCKHRGFCYSPGKEFMLNVNGKLTIKTLNYHGR